mgnify:CR=1 FL=1
MLDIEAQELLLIALYKMDNEEPGAVFPLLRVAKVAGLESMISRLRQSVVFQLQNKGYLKIVSAGPGIMITPLGREAAEKFILKNEKYK